MANPLVAAVLLNYKRPYDTIECVKALRKSTYSNLHMIVVDNASPDDSVYQISKALPGVEIIQADKNRGYAGGMNTGIRRAFQLSPQYILLANSDTIAAEYFLEMLVEALEKEPVAAAASGTIYYYPGRNKIWYAGGTIRYWRASAFSHHHLVGDGKVNVETVQYVSFVSGCAFLVRSAVLIQVGLFDERFFMYLEDTELCSRLIRSNFRLLYVPNAVLFHKVYDERLQPLSVYYSIRNRLLFLKLSGQGLSRFIGFIYLSSVLALKMLLWLLLKPPLFIACRWAIQDFVTGKFYEGSGSVLRNAHIEEYDKEVAPR